MSTMPFSNTIMPKVTACRREAGESSAEGKRFFPKQWQKCNLLSLFTYIAGWNV
jgi:hypothetical protein